MSLTPIEVGAPDHISHHRILIEIDTDDQGNVVSADSDIRVTVKDASGNTIKEHNAGALEDLGTDPVGSAADVPEFRGNAVTQIIQEVL